MDRICIDQIPIITNNYLFGSVITELGLYNKNEDPAICENYIFRAKSYIDSCMHDDHYCKTIIENPSEYGLLGYAYTKLLIDNGEAFTPSIQSVVDMMRWMHSKTVSYACKVCYAATLSEELFPINLLDTINTSIRNELYRIFFYCKFNYKPRSIEQYQNTEAYLGELSYVILFAAMDKGISIEDADNRIGILFNYIDEQNIIYE